MTVAITHPPYWLIQGMAWPQGQHPMAEAAYAIAPSLLPRTALTHHASTILDLADHYQRDTGTRVVFFSDLTRWLTHHNRSWDTYHVDWEQGIGELANGPYPGLYLTISQRAHAILCDSSRDGLTLHYPDGTNEKVSDTERDAVHHALAEALDSDWPAYAQSLIASGRIRTT